MLGGTFQPVVSRPLHRWELENLEPMGQAVLERFLLLVRVAHFCVELCNVGCNFLLCFRLGFAGEYFAAFYSLLVKVPDDTLPAAIGAAKDVAVGGESFLWHLAAPFLNHQHYRTAFAYVQTYVFRFVEKSLPVFW